LRLLGCDLICCCAITSAALLPAEMRSLLFALSSASYQIYDGLLLRLLSCDQQHIIRCSLPRLLNAMACLLFAYHANF
jgi:hypothetical protein